MAAKKIREIMGDEGLPPNPTIDIQNDEHRGMGGSYVFDPDTGKRTRVAGPELDVQPATGESESIDQEVLNNEGQ